MFLSALEGVRTPRSSGKTIGPPVHRRVRGRIEEDRRGGFPGAGHPLPGRDRERVLHRRPLGDDQEPPQCRWPARAHEHEARGAPPRAVQGRGPGARQGARPARGLRRPPPVPRPRPRDPLPPARSRARSSTPCARRTRSTSMRSAAGLYDTIWQAFAVILPVKTVGVMGDGRTYDHVCACAP
ncbi:hypothetical protein Lal_00013163 [Lupinus albus]|nr:hypothetical protein Lal_00013163 [Lupinus albus]